MKSLFLLVLFTSLSLQAGIINPPSGNAANLTGGLGGSVPYQSAASTTAMLANGSSGQVLTSSGGTSAPTWTSVSGRQTGDGFFTYKLTCGAGSMAADGSSQLRSGGAGCGGGSCANLFAAIGTTYGSVDGTHFTLPNPQGVYVRGAGTQTIAGVVYTGTQGTTQGDQMQGHFHSISASPANPLSNSTGKSPDAGTGLPLGTNTTLSVGAPTSDGVNGTPRTGTETTPANIAALNCIVY